MAVGICLVPVPTTPAALTAARNYLARQIGVSDAGTRAADGAWLPGTGAMDAATVERLDQLLATAAALIEREAPAAPQAIKNEAAVRLCGYLSEQPRRFGAVRRTAAGVSASTAGNPSADNMAEFQVNHAGAFRNCGSKGLLSPWKVRRAR